MVGLLFWGNKTFQSEAQQLNGRASEYELYGATWLQVDGTHKLLRVADGFELHKV